MAWDDYNNFDWGNAGDPNWDSGYNFDWSNFDWGGYDYGGDFNWGADPWAGYDPSMFSYQYDPQALATSDFTLPDYWGSGVPDTPLDLNDPLQGWGGGESTWADTTMSGGFPLDYSRQPDYGIDDPMRSGGPGTSGVNPNTNDFMQKLITSLTQERSQPGWSSPQGIAALGQLGLSGAGFISKFFDEGPKAKPLTPEERALHEAQLANLNAQTERIMHPIFPPSGGGGGGGFAPPSPGGAPNIAEFQKATGLNSAKFDTLYQQILKETSDLPKPDENQIAQRSQALVAEQTRDIDTRYKQAEAQILERANRLGENPAGQMAQLQEQKQRELQGLLVKARTQVLAEAQAQQAVLLGRITPAMQLLASVNPAAYADVLARVFATPTPGSTPEFREPTERPASQFGLSQGLQS